MKNSEKPKKGEIWSWKWKHSADVHTSNIIDINNEHFQLAMFGRRPNLRKIKLTDVEFLNNLSTSEDGTKLSAVTTIVNHNRISKPRTEIKKDYFINFVINNPYTLEQIKQDVCNHIWADIDGRLECDFCHKVKDEIL